LRQGFEPGKTGVGAVVNDTTLEKMMPHLEELKAQGYIKYSVTGLGLVITNQGQGLQSEFRVQVLPKYQELSLKVFAEMA
jgi:hypothetical protein